AIKECGHPHLQTTDGEGHHGRSQADGPKSPVAKQSAHGTAFEAVGHVIAGAAHGFAQCQNAKRQQQAGLRHDFTELITRALQPALWLLIFGPVFPRSGAMHTGAVPYLDFIAPGILAQSVLFVAIFYRINVIWERDLGIVQQFLASPTPRAALVLGKGFSAGIRSLSQAAIVYSLSLILGVKLNWSPLALLNVLVVVV